MIYIRYWLSISKSSAMVVFHFFSEVKIKLCPRYFTTSYVRGRECVSTSWLTEHLHFSRLSSVVGQPITLVWLINYIQSIVLQPSCMLILCYSSTRSRASGRPRPQGGPVLISCLLPMFHMKCLMQSDCLRKQGSSWHRRIMRASLCFGRAIYHKLRAQGKHISRLVYNIIDHLIYLKYI